MLSQHVSALALGLTAAVAHLRVGGAMLLVVYEFGKPYAISLDVGQVTCQALHGLLLVGVDVVLLEFAPALVLLAELGQQALDPDVMHGLTVDLEVILHDEVH